MGARGGVSRTPIQTNGTNPETTKWCEVHSRPSDFPGGHQYRRAGGTARRLPRRRRGEPTYRRSFCPRDQALQKHGVDFQHADRLVQPPQQSRSRLEVYRFLREIGSATYSYSPRRAQCGRGPRTGWDWAFPSPGPRRRPSFEADSPVLGGTPPKGWGGGFFFRAARRAGRSSIARIFDAAGEP